jgi:hypothetical protein
LLENHVLFHILPSKGCKKQHTNSLTGNRQTHTHTTLVPYPCPCSSAEANKGFSCGNY